MQTTLYDNNRVLVNKLSYKLHGIGRGDVVVFDLERGEFVKNRGADLSIQLRRRFDLLLLRLQLLLERLDFRLQREDLILLHLDALLNPAVSNC